MADGKDPVTGATVKVPRPTAYYHLTVVDGGPLQYGDNRDHDISKQHGMTMEIATPCRFTNVTSDRFGIVNEVRDCMARGDAASVGVMVQGTKGNRPFLITKCSKDLDGNERPDGAQRFELASQIWNQVWAKTFVSPEPRSLVAAPPVQPPQVAYQPYQQQAPAGYASQQYAQTGTVPTPYGAAPAQQVHPEYVTAVTQPTYNPGPAPQTDTMGYAAHLDQQQRAQQGGGIYAPPQHYPAPGGTAADWAASPYQQHAAPQPSPLAQAVQQSAPPANPAFEAWLATLPPEQQAAQRAAMAGQAQQPAGPGI
jgi:hypothetical protein